MAGLCLRASSRLTTFSLAPHGLSQARHDKLPPLAQAAITTTSRARAWCRPPACTFVLRAPYAPQDTSFSALDQVRAVHSNALWSRCSSREV
jgi:hypothetical protein